MNTNRDLYKQVHNGLGQLVIAPNKKERDKTIALLHNACAKQGIRLKTEKISPTRFYTSKVVQ